MKKLCLWILLLTVLLTACGKKTPEGSQPGSTAVPSPSEPAGIPLGDALPEKIYTLTAAGAFPLPDCFLPLGGILCLYESAIPDMPYTVLDVSGKPIGTDRYSAVTALGSGLLAVAQPTGEGSVWGLLDADPGSVLLSCSASEIRLLSDRYCRVFYATAAVAEGEPCFFYDPETEQGYIGEVRIFDVQTGSFVPDLTVTDPEKSIEICGSLICIGTAGSYEIYGSDGKLGTTLENAWISGNCILTHQSAQTVIYDSDLQEIARLDYEAYPVDGSGQYLYRFDKNFFREVLDLQGNPVLKQSYKTVRQIHQQYAVVEQDGRYGIVRTDASQICPFDYEHIFWQQDYHSFSMSDVQGRKFVLLPGCPMLETTGLDGYGLYFFTVENGQYSYRVLSTGHVLKSTGPARILGEGMLVIGTELKEIVRGSTLLSGYENYLYDANTGCVYALKDGVWNIFRFQTDLP